MPSSHLILCRSLLLLPPIPPSIRVFSSESTLPMRWPKYWSFSFSISPSNEPPGLISFRMDWLNLLAVQGTLKSLLQHHRSILDNNDEWMSRWIWKVSIDGKCPSLGWGGKQGKQSKRSCLLDHGECLFPSQRAKAQTECTQPILWSPIVLELYKYLSLPKLPNNNNCNL